MLLRSLDELLRTSDIVCLHVPLLRETVRFSDGGRHPRDPQGPGPAEVQISSASP